MAKRSGAKRDPQQADTPAPLLKYPWYQYLASIVVLQLAFNAVAVLLLFLGAILPETLGMRFGLYLLIPIVGAQFLAFPMLVARLLSATSLRGRDGFPAVFGYAIVLGFGLVIWGFVGMPLSLDAWRLQRSSEATAHSVAEVLDHGDAPMLLALPDFQLAHQPRGRYVRTSRSEDGQVSRSYYSVAALMNPEGNVDPRLWLGWEDVPVDATTATFYRVNLWNNNEYRLAVKDALGEQPPGEAMILERSLPLPAARAEAHGWLWFSAQLANGLSLGALLVIAITTAIIRLRRR